MARRVVRKIANPWCSFGTKRRRLWRLNFRFFVVICVLATLTVVTVKFGEESSISTDTLKPNLVQQRLLSLQSRAFAERRKRNRVQNVSLVVDPFATSVQADEWRTAASGDGSGSGTCDCSATSVSSGAGSGSGSTPCVCTTTTSTTTTTTTTAKPTTAAATTATATATTTTTTTTTTTPATTVPPVVTNDPDTITTQPATTQPATTQPATTTTSTTGGSGDGDDSGITMGLLIGVAVGAFVLAVLICLAIGYGCYRYYKKKRESSYKLTDAVEENSGEFGPRADQPSATLANVSAKEDLLKDALGMGSISVLTFAIQQATASGLFTVNDALMTKAQSKLNDWSRARNKLQAAYETRDLDAIEEMMTRFAAFELKDETGIYSKCADLLHERNSCKAEMRAAANMRNEDALVTSIAKFRSLNLPADYSARDGDLLVAQKSLGEIRQGRLLQGRSHNEMRLALKDAVALRNRRKIVELMKPFEEANIPDVDEDLAQADRVVKEIDAEQLALRDAAWDKIQAATMARDAGALRDALRDCRKSGMAVEEIRQSEKLLKVVEREDQLLHQMRELIVTKDAPKLQEAIAVFRTPGLQLVDKTGDVQRADELLHGLRDQQRMDRAKGDAMWRLQTARSVGDIGAMEGMLKALENLSSAGVDVDEALILRTKTEVETLKGAVDYRTRMESIKSAISRMIKTESLPQLEDLIDQMVDLSKDGHYTMTQDDARVLDQSRDILHDLKRKHALLQQIEMARPMLQVPLLPGMVDSLAKGVARMTELRDSAAEFPGVFTKSDEELLATATVNSAELKRNVEKMTIARQKLTAAMETRDYDALTEAISLAEEAPFIEPASLEAARERAAFLDPVIRCNALKTAIAARSIAEITSAVDAFKEAGVTGHDRLLAKGERTAAKLKKRQRKQIKAERKRKREDARKAAEIDELNTRLSEAMESQDVYKLQEALDLCENSGYSDGEIPMYAPAEELFDRLTVEDLRDKLADGIARRDIDLLESTIDAADYGGFVPDLEPDYSCAKDLLYSLRELHMLREKVAGMNRSLISEIQSYSKPPEVVKTVMTTTLMLLGETQKQAADWINVRAIVSKTGKDSLARRVRRNAPGDVPAELCDRVESVLGELTVEKAAEVSQGSGTFLAWITCTIKEARSLHFMKHGAESSHADLSEI